MTGILWNIIKNNKAYITHIYTHTHTNTHMHTQTQTQTHTHKHTHTYAHTHTHTRAHTHTLASGGVEVWPATACGWEQPMCSSSAYFGLCSPNGPRKPEQWTTAHSHLGRVPSHWEEEKGRTKLLREFPVYILQVSRLDGPLPG